MKKWETINRELKKISTEEEIEGYLNPFRDEIKATLIQMETKNINAAYRYIRARILLDARVSLAVLDAATFEEQKLAKAGKK